MKKKSLSNEYIAAFCMQISMLVHAGINLADGIHLLAEDEQEKSSKTLLMQIAEKMDEGRQLSDVMSGTGCFPDYMVRMAAAGEQTGRMEQAFRSMADYYENQRKLVERIKSALRYPLILLCLMLLIIGILLVKILPIFNQVYEQLGGDMDGLAGGLLLLGQGLKDILPVLGVFFIALVTAAVVVYCHVGLRAGFIRMVKKLTANRKIVKKISTSRFAAALSMGMMSGLRTDEAFEMAASFQNDSPKEQKKYEACYKMLDEGSTLSEALKENGLLEPMDCRMLSLAVKSGTADSVMEEIAGRLAEDVQNSIERQVTKVEPTMVIVTSMLIGIILVAVMIPLMNIMASIG